MFNYSFWADEGYISGVAMQFVTGKILFFNALNSPGIIYQRLYMLIISLFFKLFGINEFVARLPSMIGFLLGAFIIFLLAKRLSNVYGGILAGFIYSFSHVNLAYATQVKPYIIIQVILLYIIYLLSDRKKINHLLIIFLCCVATLLHNIGVFLWIVYLVHNILSFKNLSMKMRGLFIGIACIFILPIIFTHLKNGIFFPYNHFYQVSKLFIYKYSLIFISSFFGFIWLTKKQKTVNTAVIVYSVILLIFVTFVAYVFNIRYILFLFGPLFLYFSIFWTKVGEKYIPKKPWVIPLIVIILIYISGYKIVRWPQAYYNPNIDKYGDIQIANYKDFYEQLKKKFPNYKKLYVINDTFDVEYWYFGRYSNAYFMKFTPKPYKHHTADAMTYGSLEDFKKIIKDHDQGLLIMEDWESFLPEDIKQYAKKNLKLEFRVESLKEASDDPWPLALYSWGLPKL